MTNTAKVTFTDDTTRASDVRDSATGAGFRAPHHTASAAAILGVVRRNADGVVVHSPGEISLASAGVLLLDDVLEFDPEVLAQVGKALADGFVELHSRGDGESFAFRTEVRCRVVATVRPCPCGMKGRGLPACRCTDGMLKTWAKREERARAALLRGEVIR